AQHTQQARAQSTGASTPLLQQRQGAAPADQPAVPAMRQSKSVVHERSMSQSPAPNQNPYSATGAGPQLFSPSAMTSSQVSPHPLGSPIGLGYSPRVVSGANSIQRKGSAASMLADDMRATPTPSEASISRIATANDHVYTPEEVANAHRRSEEFLKRLPEFTSESFIPYLQGFLKENNIQGNFSKPPVFGDQSIDLYRFFCEVIRQGGLEQVHTRRIWRQVAKDSGLPDIPTLPPLLSRWYKVWLQPLEQLMVFPPGHPTHTGLNANFSLKKRRKADALVSPGSTPAPGERPFSAHSESSKRAKTHGPAVNGASSATASPAQATPPYAHSLQSPVQLSRPPPLPLGSSSLSTSALHAVGELPGLGPASLGSAPSLPTNGITPTSTRLIPPGSSIHSAHMSPDTPLSTTGSATGAPNSAPPTAPSGASKAPAPLLVTIPAPPATQQLRFFPLERSLDTVGGVDLQTYIALRPRLRQPSLSEYGSIDIRALTLSIESGITMEVTNALNTLIVLTAHPDTVLPLSHCENLAEVLFGILENIQLPTGSDERREASAEMPTYSDETSRFGLMCANDPSDGGIVGDDMQDMMAVRGLLRGGDALWSFTSDRTLTVIYALQNLSFQPVNQQFLARSTDFAHAFESVVDTCEAAVQGLDQETDAQASLTVLRALELRKSLVVILANIADKIDLRGISAGFVSAVLRLVGYFADEKQS
ncbi:hypothetical protein IWW55_005432, partial [Coemansia sp. RSA 2706]